MSDIAADKASPQPLIRRARAAHIVLILLLAIVIRGAYLYDSSSNPAFDVPVIDSMTYHQRAIEIAEEGKLSEELFWQSPFYPLFLSAVYSVADRSILAAKAVQMLLGALTCIIVYLLGVEIFDSGVGLLAGIIAAGYLPLIFFEGELLAAGWAALWAAVMIFVALKATKRDELWSCLLVGLAGALGITIRPVFLPFVLISSISIVVWRCRRGCMKRTMNRAMMVAAGFLIVAVPVGLLGYHATGRFRILPFSGGVNLYIGNNPDYEKTITARPGYAWSTFLDLPAQQGIESVYEKEKFFRREAVAYALRQPVDFMRGLSQKTAQFFSSREIPRNVDIYTFGKWSWLLRLGVWRVTGFGFPFGLLLSFGVVGAIHWRRKIPMQVWLFVILYPVSVIMVFVAARYRMPIVPILCVLASAGIMHLIELSRTRRWTRLGVFGVILLLVGITSSIPGPFREEQVAYEADLYYSLGVALEQQGKTDEAKEAYLKAINLEPNLADAHLNMGLLMDAEGKVEEAIRYYRQAIHAEPDCYPAHYNLGWAVQSQGRLDEAVTHYREAIRINPYAVVAHNNLGYALMSRGMLNEAIEHYRLAVKYKPSYAIAHLNLGNALRLGGMLSEAIEHYRLAVKYGPEYAAAHNSLGYAVLRQGNWDEAAEHFRGALGVEASLPSALIGLATILVAHPDSSKHDPEKAIALARQAAELTEYSRPKILNVLARAYAAGGYPDLAEATASRALELALEEGDRDLATSIENQLEVYRNERLMEGK